MTIGITYHYCGTTIEQIIIIDELPIDIIDASLTASTLSPKGNCCSKTSAVGNIQDYKLTCHYFCLSKPASIRLMPSMLCIRKPKFAVWLCTRPGVCLEMLSIISGYSVLQRQNTVVQLFHQHFLTLWLPLRLLPKLREIGVKQFKLQMPFSASLSIQMIRISLPFV